RSAFSCRTWRPCRDAPIAVERSPTSPQPKQKAGSTSSSNPAESRVLGFFLGTIGAECRPDTTTCQSTWEREPLYTNLAFGYIGAALRRYFCDGFFGSP